MPMPVFGLQMVIQRRQRHRGAQCEHATQHGDADEGRLPAQVGGHEQAQWHTQHGGHRERRHDDAHGAPPALKRNHIGDDGLRQGRQHPAKHTRGDPRDHQKSVARCQPAGQRRQREKHVQGEQQVLAIEAVHIGGRGQARHARRQGVGRDQQTELRIADAKEPRELRPERHHDHEVKNVGELDARDGEQQPAFAAGGEHGMCHDFGQLPNVSAPPRRAASQGFDKCPLIR
jgi:hypothetical protein